MEVLNYKQIASVLAICITFCAYYPYVRTIVQGNIKPHVFTWVIWSITTFIVFLAQVNSHAGAGAWPVGVSAIITICVALLAYNKRADSSIARSDWLFFIAALSSLPFWYITADPFWAVVILTMVDMLGFAPTYQKVYRDPFGDDPWFYAQFTVSHILVIVAMNQYSITTTLFPVAMLVACLLITVMILIRRRSLSAAD